MDGAVVGLWSGSFTGPEPLEQYQHDPVGFLVEQLGMREETVRWTLNDGYGSHVWDGTREPLIATLEALARSEDVGVEAGTATQKTYVLGAGAMLWWLACWRNSIVITAAPKKEQLALNLWKEVTKLWPHFQAAYPMAELTTLKLRMKGGIDETWAATGFVCGVGADEESANKARGFHAEHMLIICEETPGIHSAIMTAFENTSTGPHNLRLALGNPDSQQDELHRFCQSPGVTHVRISALDHPNVVAGDAGLVPGAVSSKSVARRAAKYGTDSPIFKRMVRGISPAESRFSLIRQVWIEAAVAKWLDPETREELLLVGGPALGVDVANSEDGDEAAIASGIGSVLEEVRAFPCPNNLHLGVQVALEMKLLNVADRNCGVDAGGVGAGTINKLKELRRHVQGLFAGGRAHPRIDRDVLADEGVSVLEEEVYFNFRAQMWWQMRSDLQRGRLALPPDEVLHRELVVPTWSSREGKIIVEPKEKIIERLGHSPDRADAVVLWNWVRPRPQPEKDDRDLGAFDTEMLEAEYEKFRRTRAVTTHDRPAEYDPMMVTM